MDGRAFLGECVRRASTAAPLAIEEPTTATRGRRRPVGATTAHLARHALRAVFVVASASCRGEDATPTAPVGPPPGARNVAPSPSFAVDVDLGEAPLRVLFDASESFDPDGIIGSYAWDFGDGGSGSGPLADHTYDEPGLLFADLTVADDRGAEASIRMPIFVASPPGSGSNSISGTVWFDQDLDGVRSDDEAPLARFMVFLSTDDDLALAPGDPIAFTDEHGTYTFAGLDAATTYTVTQAMPFGWSNTTPGPVGASVADRSGPVPRPVPGPATAGAEVATPIDQFPFHVALMVGGFQFCGGSFLNSRWVMTAASCVTWAESASDFDVLYGTDDLEAGGGRVAVEAIRIPEEYQWPRWNVALLRLAERVLQPRPYLLSPDQPEAARPGTESTIVGWDLSETGGVSPGFRRIDVPLLSLESCFNELGIWFDRADAGMNCAGHRSSRSTACLGALGNPHLLRGEAGEWVQIGIMVRGASLSDCWGAPFLSSSVSELYGYITSVARAENAGHVTVDWTHGISVLVDFGNYH